MPGKEPMRCERCGDNEATIHETVIKGGKPSEHYLCETCAMAIGIDPKPSQSMGVLAGLLSGQGGPEAEVVGDEPGETEKTISMLRCESCGLSFADFKQTGLLGCPACYDGFVEQIGPMIARAHEGATHHVGKLPRRALAESVARGGPEGVEGLVGSAQMRAQRMASLRLRLDQAVQAEQYELAARIKQEIASLCRREGVAGDPGSHDPDPDSGPDPSDPGPDKPGA